MNLRPTTLERAFELARSGECATVSDIRERLKREGFDSVAGQVSGRSLTEDLRRLCREATGASQPISNLKRRESGDLPQLDPLTN
jgi:uncharacterized protein with von Willebrand factor type A (vWA) domain